MYDKIIKPLKDIWQIIKSHEGMVFITVLVVLIMAHRHWDFNAFPGNMRYVEKRFFEGVWYLFLPFLVSVVFLKKNPLKFGLIGADVKLSAFYFFLMLIIIIPLVVIAAKFPSFVKYYPQFKGAAKSTELLIYYEIVMMIYFLGWEYLYRGFMLFSLREKFGDGLAILIQTLPFAVLHLRKPEIEAFMAILAGLILGVIALRTRSIWPGVLVHWCAAVSMDLLALHSKGQLVH